METRDPHPPMRSGGAARADRPTRPVPARFSPEQRLGQGAFGEVWRALDAATGQRVALKLIDLDDRDDRRFRREVGALRHLDLPGVVRLVDWGAADGHGWIAMELVEGRPFPGLGRPTRWEALAPRVEALLARLGPLHAAGVVHRDLKPTNILIDAAGVPTILDFGLARGAPIGSTFTGSRAVMGTPRYMAPEQCRGQRADARADLYAVGVMIYEALAGEVPHDHDEVLVLVHARGSFRAPSLAQVAPDVPAAVARAVDALLAVEPARRPPTAEAAARLLRGAGMRPGPLPLLGDTAGIDALVERARSGRGAVVSGPPGSGRSRWLAEAKVRLTAEGWEVVAVPPGSRPYQSLAAALGVDAPGPEIEAAVGAALATLSARNVVLLADGLEDLDRWSRRRIEQALDVAPVLASAAQGGSVSPPTLPPEALEPLFAGPERFFHLPSDAASLLWRRTNGHPAAVEAELDAWAARGLASWEGGRVRVSRADLERIEAGVLPLGDPGAGVRDAALDELLHWVARAGPGVSAEALARARGEEPWATGLELAALVEAGALRRVGDGFAVVGALPEPFDPERGRAIHAALAEGCARGSAARVGHLLAAGRVEEAEAEAGPAAWTLVAEGRPAAAVGLLEEAVEAAGGTPAAGMAARTLAAASWADRSGELARRARFLAERLELDPEVRALLGAAPGGGRAPAPDQVAALPAQADPRLEALRRELRVAVAMRRGREAWAAEVAEAVRWAEGTGDAELVARARAWEADLAYAGSDLTRAAALAEAAAAGTTVVADELGRLFRAASVYLEQGDVARTEAVASRLRDTAARHRLPMHEARGAVVLRLLAERTGRAEGVDHEAVEAAEALGDPSLTGNLVLAEARVAWRTGDRPAARALAGRAVEWFERVGYTAGALCARALALAAGAPEDPAALVRTMDTLDRPDVTIEVVGLLAAARALPPGDWAGRIDAAASRMPAYPRSWPHGAFSYEGALAEIKRLEG